jgi:hypothetical protein
MSKLGKIVLDGNYRNPFVIITEGNPYPRALELVVTDDERGSLKLKDDEITRINYRGKKLAGRSVDLRRVHGISNLDIREIGVLQEETFCKVLRFFNNYQVCKGADSYGFKEVRNEVQVYLLKKTSK